MWIRPRPRHLAPSLFCRLPFPFRPRCVYQPGCFWVPLPVSFRLCPLPPGPSPLLACPCPAQPSDVQGAVSLFHFDLYPPPPTCAVGGPRWPTPCSGPLSFPSCCHPCLWFFACTSTFPCSVISGNSPRCESPFPTLLPPPTFTFLLPRSPLLAPPPLPFTLRAAPILLEDFGDRVDRRPLVGPPDHRLPVSCVFSWFLPIPCLFSLGPVPLGPFCPLCCCILPPLAL